MISLVKQQLLNKKNLNNKFTEENLQWCPFSEKICNCNVTKNILHGSNRSLLDDCFSISTVQKIKFSIKAFLSFLRIWSHLLKKSFMENFIFCAVLIFFVVSWIITKYVKTILRNTMQNVYTISSYLSLSIPTWKHHKTRSYLMFSESRERPVTWNESKSGSEAATGEVLWKKLFLKNFAMFTQMRWSLL